MCSSSARSPDISTWKTAITFFANICEALSELPKVSRYFHIFWLLGPFFMLIERSPADIWLTICALTFAVRAVFKKESFWLRVFWVKSVFVFWALCLFSALLSDLPLYSFGEAFIWIRFPLFAMATCFWLGRDSRLLFGMFISTLLGMIVMTGILVSEILILGHQAGRLSWPYGDLMPGNYLTKVGLPCFSILVALAVSAKKSVAVPCSMLSLLTIIISAMTGERINFIIRACGGMLASLMFKPKISRLIALLAIEVLAICLVFVTMPIIGTRFTDTFIKQLPHNADSPYLVIWRGGIEAFYTAPIFGIGPDNYRYLCSEISADISDVVCSNHPHNYYIQVLGETGLVGLFAGLVMLGAIIWSCFNCRLQNGANVVTATAFIVPLGLFFPLQSTADFFGQWNNIFMWSAVALALASVNLVERKQ